MVPRGTPLRMRTQLYNILHSLSIKWKIHWQTSKRLTFHLHDHYLDTARKHKACSLAAMSKALAFQEILYVQTNLDTIILVIVVLLVICVYLHYMFVLFFLSFSFIVLYDSLFFVYRWVIKNIHSFIQR